MEAELSRNAPTRPRDAVGAVMGPGLQSQRSVVDTNNIDGSRKIQRVSRACDACKLRKSKCSGTNPCRTCVRRGLQCLYLSKYGRGRPPTPTATPICTPTSSTAQVDLGESTAVVEPESTTACVSHSQGGWPGTPRATIEAPMINVQGRGYDPTSALAFLDRAWKRLSTTRRQLSVIDDDALADTEKHQAQVAAGDQPFDVSPRSDEEPSLPVRSEALNLFVFYFDVCTATYRFLHRPSVKQWLISLLDNSEHGRPHHHGLGESRTAIIFGILAIAEYHKCQFRGKDISSTPSSDQLFRRATLMTERATGFPNLESVQARIIQVLYLLHTSRMNQAWYVFGGTVQMIWALGLHRFETRIRISASKKTQSDYIGSQCQKRVFWVSYILDQYLSVLFARPRHYHDYDIDQSFPDCVDDEDMTPDGPMLPSRTKDCYVTALVFHAKIARILSYITSEIYSVKPFPTKRLLSFVGRVKSDITEWKTQLPPFLGSISPSSLAPPFSRQATVLRLAYSHAVIHATRPLLLGGTSEDLNTANEQISHCISSARLVLETADAMASDDPLFYAFWWTHYVVFASLTVVYMWEIQRHLSTLYGQDYHEQLFKLAERCQNHLAEATAPNSPGRRYSIILQELQSEAKRSIAGSAVHSLSMHRGRQALERDDMPSEVPDPSAERYNSGTVSGAVDIDGGIQHHVWNNWQTTDWLEINSLACGEYPVFGSTTGSWFTETPNPQ